MSFWIWLLVAIVPGIEIFALACYHANFRKPLKDSSRENKPLISVMIAARNEESNLDKCLKSLALQTYPTNRFEVLIGDDQSTDGTAEVIHEATAFYENVHEVPIIANHNGLVAKSNVLNQLSKRAKGEYLVILDADMNVSRDWLSGMLQAMNGYDIVSGYTIVQGTNWFSRVQQFAWRKAQFFMKAMADMRQPVSLLGNNLMISASVFNKIGGFETLGPTYTEDFDLLQVAKKERMRVFQLVSSQANATTQSIGNLKGWLQQQKRWMAAAFRLPIALIVVLLLQHVFTLSLVFVIIMDWQVGFGMVITYMILQIGLLSSTQTPIKESKWVFFNSLIISILNLIALGYYILPFKKTWKGRSI